MLIYEKDIVKHIANCQVAVCNMFSCTIANKISDISNLQVYTYIFDVSCNEKRYKSVKFLAYEIKDNFYICSDYVIVSNANLKLSNRVCWFRIDYNKDYYLNLLNTLPLVNPSIERYIKL
jgi:hypothetical protein